MTPQIVIIRWSDACGSGGWHDLNEILDTELSIHNTVGWLIDEREDSYTVCMSYDEVNDCYGSYDVIPKVNVLEMRLPFSSGLVLEEVIHTPQS